MTYPDREPAWSPPLLLWLAVLFTILAVGIALWILNQSETCIAGQIVDSTSQTIFPVECT